MLIWNRISERAVTKFFLFKCFVTIILVAMISRTNYIRLFGRVLVYARSTWLFSNESRYVTFTKQTRANVSHHIKSDFFKDNSIKRNTYSTSSNGSVLSRIKGKKLTKPFLLKHRLKDLSNQRSCPFPWSSTRPNSSNLEGSFSSYPYSKSSVMLY